MMVTDMEKTNLRSIREPEPSMIDGTTSTMTSSSSSLDPSFSLDSHDHQNNGTTTTTTSTSTIVSKHSTLSEDPSERSDCEFHTHLSIDSSEDIIDDDMTANLDDDIDDIDEADDDTAVAGNHDRRDRRDDRIHEDDNDEEYDDDELDDYDEQVQRRIEEEAELVKEANKTRMSYLAYRNALMHLIHNQDRQKHDDDNDDNTTTTTTDGGGATEEDGEEKHATPSTEEESDEKAQERMSVLESQARSIVETKANAFFQAIHVVEEWKVRREQRNVLFRKTKMSLAMEMQRRQEQKQQQQQEEEEEEVTTSHQAAPQAQSPSPSPPPPSSSSQAALPSKIVKGKIKNKFEEEKKEESTSSSSRPTLKVSGRSSMGSFNMSSGEKATPSYVKELKIRLTHQGYPNGPKSSFIRPPTNKYYHPDCKLHTYPKFEYQTAEEKNKMKEKKQSDYDDDYDGGEMNFGTTKSISSMVTWRMRRRQYIFDTHRKCGCSGCMLKLSDMETGTSK